MSKKQFIIRLVIYILIGLIIPICFFAWKFDLFNEVTKTNVSGWGIVLIIFVCTFLLGLLKSLKDGMKPGLAKQCIDGVCKITIPLITASLILYWVSGVTDELIEVLVFLSIVETIAIPINPIPQWALENNIEMKTSFFVKIGDILGIGSKK